ncbi:MAG: hypothetical protein EZS28_034160 [Streblomastix strix]|uniref:C2CD5 C-terminal domain-containing protein n=1 Tax=Streblomastix strix TaxID=222440 RepID=A0A5J4UJB6_9EUKA|nr:MAG: hypothetical protein EZS28_034160 [Streblomastix strix]
MLPTLNLLVLLLLKRISFSIPSPGTALSFVSSANPTSSPINEQKNDDQQQKEKSNVVVSPDINISGTRTELAGGYVNFILIREDENVKEGDEDSFMNKVVEEGLEQCKQVASAQRCNAVIGVQIDLVEVVRNASKKNIYIVLNVSGDIVNNQNKYMQ